MILTNNIPILYERLLKIAETKLDGVDLRPKIDIDAEVTLKDLRAALSETCSGWPVRTGQSAAGFCHRKVKSVGCRTMGSDGGHLRLKLEQNGMVWDSVAFGFGPHQSKCPTRSISSTISNSTSGTVNPP